MSRLPLVTERITQLNNTTTKTCEQVAVVKVIADQNRRRYRVTQVTVCSLAVSFNRAACTQHENTTRSTQSRLDTDTAVSASPLRSSCRVPARRFPGRP